MAALIEAAPPELADALGQLVVLPPPEGEPDRIVGQFLHDAAIRRLGELQREAQRSGDPALMPAITDLRLLIPEVRSASFDLPTATGLVPLLTSGENV